MDIQGRMTVAHWSFIKLWIRTLVYLHKYIRNNKQKTNGFTRNKQKTNGFTKHKQKTNGFTNIKDANGSTNKKQT